MLFVNITSNRARKAAMSSEYKAVEANALVQVAALYNFPARCHL